jgi:hypothetical protein
VNRPKHDVLLFVEDPSAANYASLLMPTLRDAGLASELLASGVAKSWLTEKGVNFSAVASDADASAILQDFRPKCVLIGTASNPRSLGLRMLCEARRIPNTISIGFVDALMASSNRFRGESTNPLEYAPQKLLVPDKRTRQEFISLGYPSASIFICGHPQYDVAIETGKRWRSQGYRAHLREKLFPGLEKKRKVLVFVSEGAPRYRRPSREPKYSFSGRGKDVGRTKLILEEILDACKTIPEKPYFVFRAHPTETIGSYVDYASEIDLFSADAAPLELVFGSDVIIGMTSMLLYESHLMGKATAAVLPSDGDDQLLACVRDESVPVIRNRTELKVVLSKILNQSDYEFTNQEHNSCFIGARQKIVQLLLGFISNDAKING